jgi:phospholipid transport system substrate-binding protein
MKITTRTILLAAASMAILSGGSAAMASGQFDAGSAAPSTLMVTVAEDAAGEGAKQFIVKMGDRGINFLGDASKSQEAKKAEFSSLLDQSFDMSTIGRFVLGTYWKSATPAQQTEYQKLFRKMIISVYSKRFSDYNGQKFDVRTAKTDGKDTTVTSYIVPGSGPEVRVDWRVRNKGGNYKVVDIIVEGVSMAMTQRADFASVIQRGGGDIETLLTHLRGQQ